MSEVKWIKIATDIFDDEKILLLESMPDKYAIITCWFKILCLAGKQNNKGVFLLNDRIPYTDEMLATIFRMDINTVKLALKSFEEFGMIERIEGVITIPNWDKHQKLDSLENKREYMKNYMAEKRANQKQLACKTNSKTNVSSLDKDKEIDKEEEKKETIINNSKENEIDDIFLYWNSQKIIKHSELTKIIKGAIIGALKNYSCEVIKTCIARYKEMLDSKYEYCEYKWTLENFLKQKNAISEFTDEGSKWNNYLTWKSKVDKTSKPKESRFSKEIM